MIELNDLEKKIPIQLVDRIKTHLPPIDGWCSELKAIHIASEIVRLQAKNCVEIGVYGGKSLIPAAMALDYMDSGHIIGIDPYYAQFDAIGQGPDSPHYNVNHYNWWQKLNYRDVLSKAENHLRIHHLKNRASLWIVDSKTASNFIPNKSLDFLHIDGNHSEESSCLDVQIWLPKMKNESVIFFDDVDWSSTKKAQLLLSDWSMQIVNQGNYSVYINKKNNIKIKSKKNKRSKLILNIKNNSLK